MADINDLEHFDPFSIQPAKANGVVATLPTPAQSGGNDDLQNFDPFSYGEPAENKTSMPGAALRGVIGGTAPAAGSLAGAAPGAEAGAVVGEALFPWGGALPGAILGGIGGAYAGAEGVATAQNWLLSKVPKLRDMLGQSEEQKRLDEQEHPVASFLGGLAPFAITMSPGAVARALPENATAWQRLAANPYTARLFSGGVMGGMQLGQEAASEDKINWNRVAIATVFGMIFNKPNRIGEAISEFGAKPARMLLGRPSPSPARPPTLAEVSDQNVAGPGVTESTFMGSEARNPAAELAAEHTAGIEDSVIGPIRTPDLENLARQKEPDLFNEYDSLLARKAAFQGWINDYNEPKPYQFLELEEKRAALEADLAEHVGARNGYAGGPRARSLRAQIREVQAEHDALTERAAAFKGGTAQETADLALARKHLLDTDFALRDLQPRIRAAYASAADYMGAPTVEAPPPEVAVPPQATVAEAPAGAPAPAATAGAATPHGPVDEQKAFIAKDVADRMRAAGRPAEEAELAGQLVAARYVSRAARFGGALGSAIDLYKAEGPKIIGGRITTPTRTAATPEPAPLPTNRQELAAFLAGGGEVAAAPATSIAAPEAKVAPEEPAVEVKARRPGGPAAKDQSKYSILEFLASRGGLKADPDTMTIFGGKNPFIPGFGRLFRAGGMSADHALEAAIEAGYIVDAGREAGTAPQVFPDDLRNLMDAEARGAKQYRLGEGAPERKVDIDQERHRMNGALDDALDQLGVKPESVPQELRDRVLHLMEKEGVRDPLQAWEQVTNHEDHFAAEAGKVESLAQGQREWTEPVPNEPGAAPGQGAEAETGRQQPAGAKAGEPARIAGGGHPEPVEEAGPLAHLTQQDIDDFFQATHGAIRFVEGDRPIITLLQNADASTIIHELGHGWLEELMRDSQHPAAPDGVRNDADTVLKWVGLKTANELTERTKKGNPTARATKAHERFARGFEQYMRDGVAPSAELATVFARFKAWLLDLYKTISGLGKEISPDIRGVFDRMLTEEPGQTVIGQTRGGGPTITDIHEADAKLTEPAEGEQARDRVTAERDRYVEEQPPQIKAELEARAAEAGIEIKPAAAGTEPAGEGGAGPGGPGEVVGGGGAAGPVAAGGGSGAERRPVVESGANAGPESAALPGAGQRAAGSATEREHPLASGPAADHIPRGESKTVDLAGNIRVENLTTVDDVKQAIRDSADRNDDFRAVRGDPMTKGMMWDLATEIGIDPVEMDDAALQTHLEDLVGGMRDMAPKVLAMRRLAKQSAMIVADLMKKAALSDADADAYELARAISRHDMITSALSGGTASWGRTGSAFHDISGDWDTQAINQLLKQETGRTLFQIKQIAKLGAEYDTTGKISKFIRDTGRKSAWRMLTEYWINGLISGIQTHVTYSVGNTILAIEKTGPETAAAAGIGALRRALGREGQTVRLGEVAAGLRGVREGFWPAVQSALNAARSGVTTLLPGEKPAQTKRFQPPLTAGSELVKAAVLNEAATFQDAMETAYGIMRGLRDAVVAGAALQHAGGLPGAPLFGWEYSPLGAIPNLQIRGVTMLPVGDIARAPSRMIAAIHSFFRPLNYSIDVNQRAYRAAASENLTGTHFDSRVAELRQNPTPEIMQAAHNASNELTLMGAGGQFTRKLSALVNTEFFGTKDASGKVLPGTGLPLLKFIDPFIHISSNIINQSIVQRTPLGILSTSVRNDLLGRNGTIAADTAAARMLVGTAFSLLFGGLAAEGYISGSEPTDPREAALWRQVYQAHSVLIGDTWYDMHRLGPMGMLLSTAADLYQVAHMADQGDMVKAASTLQHAITQNILDESFMRGPSDLIKAVEDPTRYGESYIKNFVSSFVPFSVAMSQMARASDPYSRQARTVVDAIKAKVPMLSQSLMPRRDVWGEILPSRDNLGPPGITAIWEQKQNNDPVNRAMLELGIHPAAVQRKIRNVDLTDEQYDDWSRLAGRLAKLRMDAIVRSPSFQNMPSYLKHDLIVEQLRQSREVARGIMFAKFPSILVDAQAAKMAKRGAPQ